MHITSKMQSKRDTFYYYPASPDPDEGVYAIRWNQYKAHFYTYGYTYLLGMFTLEYLVELYGMHGGYGIA